MKTLLCCSIASLFLNVESSAIRAYFDYNVFYIPEQGSYTEFIVSIEGESITYKLMDNDQHQASAEVTLIITKNDQIIEFRKVLVDGPIETMLSKSDFMSLERFMIPAGEYDLEIGLRDLNDPINSVETLHQKFEIVYQSEAIFVSDISFISAYTTTTEPNAFSKSGYDLIPYVSDYFPSAISSILVYAEVYNTSQILGQNQPFVISISIENSAAVKLKDIGRIRKEKSNAVCAILQNLDISELPSGDYYMVIEAKDKTNNTLATKRLKFTRNLVIAEAVQPEIENAVQSTLVTNTGTERYLLLDSAMTIGTFVTQWQDADSLYEAIRSMLPISSSQERFSIDHQLTDRDMSQLRSFMYVFWQNRSPQNAEAGWNKYKDELKSVDQAFGSWVKRGWETDRGRVYLQYGPPNTRIERHHNPDYYPYEIWHYYETNGFHNCKLLFTNPSLSGDFELIHTDNMPAEIRNAGWKQLAMSAQQSMPVATGREAFNQRDSYSGDELEDLWNNPH